MDTAAGLPLEGCTYNLEVTCTAIPPLSAGRGKGKAKELAYIFKPLQLWPLVK